MGKFMKWLKRHKVIVCIILLSLIWLIFNPLFRFERKEGEYIRTNRITGTKYVYATDKHPAYSIYKNGKIQIHFPYDDFDPSDETFILK